MMSAKGTVYSIRAKILTFIEDLNSERLVEEQQEDGCNTFEIYEAIRALREASSHLRKAYSNV